MKQSAFRSAGIGRTECACCNTYPRCAHFRSIEAASGFNRPEIALVVFLGDSRDRIRKFPEWARRQVGVELRQVQYGLDPSDWKPMKSVGPGVREIRVRGMVGAYRVLYVAMLADAVYVLHAFQKKSRATAQRELDLAALRLRLLR